MSCFFNSFQIFIIVIMVLGGSLCTILLKWIDETPACNSIGEIVPFTHTFLQPTFGFVAELLCLALFYLPKAFRKSTEKGG